jgi:hypothetical protein
MLVLREKEFSGNNVGSVRCVGVEVESSTFGMLLQDIATRSPNTEDHPFFPVQNLNQPHPLYYEESM